MASLRHPCKFQRVSCLGSITALHSSSGRQPNFAALNRGRHLYSTGRPSRWALAHILVLSFLSPNLSRRRLDLYHTSTHGVALIRILVTFCVLYFQRAPCSTFQPSSQSGCLPSLHTWCGLSANLRCRSETCCTRLAENTGRKKSPKIAICASSHNFVGLYLGKAYVDHRKKKLLDSNISSTYPHNMVNFGPLAAEIVSLVWGTAANLNGFRVFASLLQRRRSTKANQTLHNV